MKFRYLCFFVLLVCLSLFGCNMPLSSGSDGQVGNVQTWIDAPLNGSTIPLAPYEIVLHAYDPAGVTQVELKVNGSLLAVLPNPNASQLLATLKYPWSPVSPGNYTLSARAQGSNGLWGSETAITVTVAGLVGTPTLVDTLTPSPTLVNTLTPTLISTITLTATTVPAALSFTPRISSNQFYYGNCGSDQVTIQVYVSGGNVYNVVLFTQLKDQTGWDEGSGMTPSGDGWFSRTIMSRSVAGADRIGSALLLYQFVATDNAGGVVGRSQVYSDITLNACLAPPPIQPITPVRPSIITVTSPPRFVRPTATPIPPPK
jgi:predicted small secreted protein